MKMVKVKKSELLEILKKNRQSHRTMFEKAQKGYRKEAIRLLDEALKDAREGRKVKTFIQLDAPIDQTEDYDVAIKMVEMSVDGNIELSEQDFKCYILDQWHWRQICLTTNSFYAGKA